MAYIRRVLEDARIGPSLRATLDQRAQRAIDDLAAAGVDLGDPEVVRVAGAVVLHLEGVGLDEFRAEWSHGKLHATMAAAAQVQGQIQGLMAALLARDPQVRS